MIREIFKLKYKKVKMINALQTKILELKIYFFPKQKNITTIFMNTLTIRILIMFILELLSTVWFVLRFRPNIKSKENKFQAWGLVACLEFLIILKPLINLYVKMKVSFLVKLSRKTKDYFKIDRYENEKEKFEYKLKN